MALSRVTIPGDGVTTTFTVSFALGYINEDDITARVGDEVDGLGDPAYRNITFISAELLQIDGPPAGVGVNVVFERTVEDNVLLVDYENGDIINDSNLNTAQKQALMLVHQVLDGRFTAIDNDIDLGGHRITNSADPVDPTDLATKQYVDVTIPANVAAAEAAAASAIISANTATVQAGVATVQATNASNSAAASDLFKDHAHDWAQLDEDEQVDDGEHPVGFSAYHWAQKAQSEVIDVVHTDDIGVLVQAYNAYLDTVAAYGSGDGLLDALNIPPYVDDRTALKALDTTKIKAAFVRGASGGIFDFVAGDWTSIFTVDVTEGFLVKATAVAINTGGWIRRNLGYDLNTIQFGNTQAGWQSAINVAAILGTNVMAQGTCTLSTVNIKMQPNVHLYSTGLGKATLTQGTNGLSNLIDWSTNSANGAWLSKMVVNGNRANNTDDGNKSLLLVWNATDVHIEDCQLINSVGMVIHGKGGLNTGYYRNKIDNCFSIPIFVSPVVPAVVVTANMDIIDNEITGQWGQHAIMIEYFRNTRIKGNKIAGSAQRGFNVTVTGTAVTTTGSFFSINSVGKFLIYNGGIEALIVGFTNANAVTIHAATGNCVTQPAVWGNGDVIGATSCPTCEIAENRVLGGASLGISIFANVQNSISTIVRDNFILSMGSAAISIQVAGGASVFDTLIQGNHITDPAMNNLAAAASANVGVVVIGGANVNRVSVSNNAIIAYNGFMQWAVSYTAGVLAKTTTGGMHGGSVNTTNNSVQNP